MHFHVEKYTTRQIKRIRDIFVNFVLAVLLAWLLLHNGKHAEMRHVVRLGVRVCLAPNCKKINIASYSFFVSTNL